MRTPISVCISFALIWTGPAAESKPTPSPSPGKTLIGEVRDITEKEATEFARLVDAEAAKGDVSILSDRFDGKVLGERVCHGLKLHKDFLEAIRAKLARDGMKRLATNVAASIKGGGKYRFVRCLNANGYLRPVYRLNTNDGLVNYHEFRLGRAPDGRLMFVDVYVFISGELLSTTLRRLVRMTAAPKGGTGTGSSQTDMMRSLPDVREFMRLRAMGRNEEALRKFDGLPESVRKEKVFLMARVVVASNLDDKIYAAALEELVKLHGNDPGIDMSLISHYLATEQYKKAMSAVERLSKRLGGDAYMDAYRGRIYLDQKQYPQARQAAERALKADMGISDPLALLLEVSLGEKKFGEALIILKLLHNDYGETMAVTPEDPTYREFIKDPAYKEWLLFLKEHEKKEAPKGP